MTKFTKLLGAAAALALTAGTASADPALIYDLGGKFDKSFNEAAFGGAQRWAAETGGTFRLGRRVRAVLKEATPVTGGLIFESVSAPEKGKPPKHMARTSKAYKGGRRGGSQPRKKRGAKR